MFSKVFITVALLVATFALISEAFPHGGKYTFIYSFRIINIEFLFLLQNLKLTENVFDSGMENRDFDMVTSDFDTMTSDFETMTSDSDAIILPLDLN